jgi:hypothetical protein
MRRKWTNLSNSIHAHRNTVKKKVSKSGMEQMVLIEWGIIMGFQKKKRLSGKDKSAGEH